MNSQGFRDPEGAENRDARYAASGKREVDPLLVVSRVSAAVSDLENLDTILNIGLSTTLGFMHGVAGGIMLLDEEQDLLYYRVSYGLSRNYFQSMYMRPGEGIAGKAVQSKKPVQVNDISAEPEAVRPELINMEGIRAFVSVPLRVREKVIGVMNCASKESSCFGNQDMHLFQSIGDQLGLAIKQADLRRQLYKSRESYRKLSRKLIATQEEERTRIARELHDETGQSLAALSLNLSALMEMTQVLDIEDSKYTNTLEKIQNLAARIHTDLNRVVASLRPNQLETLGLISAIRDYVNNNVPLKGINAELDLEDIESDIHPDHKLNIFRWVQSAVSNVIQHSGAKNMRLSMRKQEDQLILIVSDDGRGFEREALSESREQDRGYGLLNMKERMLLIGGTCSLQSRPQEGTTVTAEIPLSSRSKPSAPAPCRRSPSHNKDQPGSL